MRLFGWLLLVATLLLAVGLRLRSAERAERLFVGEAVARERLRDLGRALDVALDGSTPAAQRLALFGRLLGQEPLPQAATDVTAYGRDEVYVYGLGLTTQVDGEGRLRPGWVLRAWPRQFGVTGDLEFHLDQTGTFWEGQNEVGRSGLEQGFPPAFPERELVSQDKHKSWWPVAPRAASAAGTNRPAQR